MGNRPAGVYAWIWTHPSHGESVRATVDKCKDYGLAGVYVRAWNGTRGVNPQGYSFINQYKEYLQFKTDDFNIIPWTYVYGPAAGNNPIQEAHTFADAVLPSNPPFIVVDIEHEGNSREYGGQPAATKVLFETLVSRFGKERVSFAPYDLPSVHSYYEIDEQRVNRTDGLYYHTMARQSGFAVPQMYFADRAIRGPHAVTRMVNDWGAFGFKLPLYPAIQGYGVTKQETVDVARVVPGFSVWRYDVISQPVWDGIKQIQTEGIYNVPSEEVEELKRLLEAEKQKVRARDDIINGLTYRIAYVGPRLVAAKAATDAQVKAFGEIAAALDLNKPRPV